MNPTSKSYFYNLPVSRDERKEWGAISENLALAAGTPCSS